jgi:hypothetical protein
VRGDAWRFDLREAARSRNKQGGFCPLLSC